MGKGFSKGFDPRYPFWKDKFSPAYYVRKPELIPLVAMKVITMFNWAWISLYFLATKPDVSWYEDKKKKRWDRGMDLNNPTVNKFIEINHIYPPMPELANIYKSMDDKERELTEL